MSLSSFIPDREMVFPRLFLKDTLGTQSYRKVTVELGQPHADLRKEGTAICLHQAWLSQVCARGRGDLVLMEGRGKNVDFATSHLVHRCLQNSCFLLGACLHREKELWTDWLLTF